jgi:hypothetical protein
MSRTIVRVALLAVVVIIGGAALVAAAPQGASGQGSTPQATAEQNTSRGGFVIGFGGGFGWTNWRLAPYITYTSISTYPYYRMVTVTPEGGYSGFSTNFKIGWGLNDRLLLLFQSTGMFLSPGEGYDTHMDGMGGLAVQYYLSGKRGRAPYVIGGAGYHNMMRLDVENGGGSNSLGFGVRGGAGYEFAKHFTVEAVFQHGFNSDERNPTSFSISLNAIWRR